MSSPTAERRVYLPPDRLDSCCVCQKTIKHICLACFERPYCSKACQKLDWDSVHKQTCGSTDLIEISSFYPMLAILADVCHEQATQARPHPALMHEIVEMTSGPFDLPNDTSARVVFLGPAINRNDPSSVWWPTAPSKRASSRLFGRIAREGNVLPIAAALCIALLSTMYTTTSSRATRHTERRVRLKYGKSPVIDFGIAKGAVDVKSQDRLAYFDGTRFWNGQDPNDHYWIYFRTGRGETVVFDPGLYAFNFGIMVDSTPTYTAGFAPNILPSSGVAKFVPGIFMGKEVNKDTIGLHRDWQCISVLRNEALHRAIRNVGGPDAHFTPSDLDTIWAFVKTYSGPNPLLPHSRLDMGSFILRNIRAIEDVLHRRAWVHWPELNFIPGAIDDEDPNADPNRADEKWVKILKKLTKKYKAGEISRETYDAEMRKSMRSVSTRA